MKRKTTILVIAGILLVIAVVVALIYSNKDNTNTSNTNTAVNAPIVNIVSNTNTAVNATNSISQEEQQRNEANRAASIFVEQFGTYNGGFNEEVLGNLAPLVTDAYETTLQKTIVAGSVNENTSITTQVLNTSLTDFSMSVSAVVTVSTLRVQTSGDDQKETQLSQEIVVRETYSNGQWLVSAAEWKTPQSLDSL